MNSVPSFDEELSPAWVPFKMAENVCGGVRVFEKVARFARLSVDVTFKMEVAELDVVRDKMV